MNNFKMAARFFKNVLFLFKSCLMQTKRHRKVNVMLKADHKLRLNPIRDRSVFMTWGGAGDFLGGDSFFIKILGGVPFLD